MTESPTEHVRRPKIDTESTTLGLDRMELGAFLAQAAAAGPVDHALACLLGLLGLRVSEACRIDIEDLGSEQGHRTVTVLGKGSKLALIPLPPGSVGPSTWPPATAWPARSCVAVRQAPRPPRRHPHRPPGGQQGPDHHAHLPELAEAQLHNGGT